MQPHRETLPLDVDVQNRLSPERVRSVTLALLNNCRESNWEGWDPYDVLNSRFLELVPFLDTKIPRLVLTQALKRIPVNIRPLLLIPKAQNPKAMGLFLMALVKLEKLGLLDDAELIPYMIERLVDLRSPNTPYYCWGYSFPWQTRTVYVPRAAPNLVCTVFVADSLLDAFENSGDDKCLSMALSAANYILEKLYWKESDSEAGFSYPIERVRSRIHNANFLASALFGRLHKLTGAERFLEPALAAARYAVSRQQEDGSWFYGELPKQRWIDNFHTGYNLCALHSLGRDIGTSEFDRSIDIGFSFYRQHFFTNDNAPKYFHDKTFPIDIHSAAQSIITLLEMKCLDETCVDQAYSVLSWTMGHLWDKKGFFYYRYSPHFKNKISFIRWSQAWMLLASTCFLGQYQTNSSENIL